MVYDREGEYQKAKELYEKAIRINERVFGEEHSNTVISYNNLAGVYAAQGECKRALIFYRKSYNILLLKFGQNHPDTQIVYESMQQVYIEWNPEGDFKQWITEE